jgi:TPR repeat protein
MKAVVNLANVFHKGSGVKPDPELSYMWLLIAADGGEDVTEALHLASLAMSEHQLNEARQRAGAWREQHHLEPVRSNLASSDSRGVTATH